MHIGPAFTTNCTQVYNNNNKNINVYKKLHTGPAFTKNYTLGQCYNKLHTGPVFTRNYTKGQSLQEITHRASVHSELHTGPAYYTILHTWSVFTIICT